MTLPQPLQAQSPLDRGLNGIAVYNPSLWNDAELDLYFIARHDILAKIVDNLKREQPGIPGQPQLILGLPGMGKTTLLRRIALAVRQDEALNQIWLPLSFPEEQYNIIKLKDLWLNCLVALSELLETSGCDEEMDELDDIIASSKDLDSDEILAILLEAAKKYNKRLLLLIDNIDLILDRLKKDHWHIREILQAQPQLLFIGASSRAVEATYKYDAAFYDFFNIIELKRLTLEETHNILTRLAKTFNVSRVIDIIHHQPARINTLHTLTGGNPRTVALLFNILSQRLDGDVRSDLEGLLDMVTPLYKSRLEELPHASKQIVDAIALHWDPISAKDLATKLEIPVNNISSLLSRLENNQTIEKVAPASGKRAAFQISERFFNIWYLMRASRRIRKKLMWLVYFLEMFFSAHKFEVHGQQQLKSKRSLNQRDTKYSLALGQIASDQIKRVIKLKDSNISEKSWPEFIELFRLAIQRDKAPELLDIIDNSPAAEHWRPLREALASIVADSVELLNGVAPEVRAPALVLVEQLTSDIRVL
ncbi:MAG: DNA-binding transcriptional regulator GbsR (MarR family) [Phenylobacterium sp.]|jgi:DNA-binding transcriptional regulator GbsR (MarR family)